MGGGKALDADAFGAKKKKRSNKKYQKDYYKKNKKRLLEVKAARWTANEGGYRDRGLTRQREKRSRVRAVRASEKFQQALNNYRSGWVCSNPECNEIIFGGSLRSKVCDTCGEETLSRGIIVSVALCSKCERTLPWEGEERSCGVCTGTLKEGYKVLSTKVPRLVKGSDVGIKKREVWVYSSGVLAAFCGKSPATIRTWIERRVVPGCSIVMGTDHQTYWFTEEFMRAVAEGYRKTLLVDGRAPHGKLRRHINQELKDQGVQLKEFC